MKRYMMGTMACLALSFTSFGATKSPPSAGSDVLAGELRLVDADLPDIQRFPLEHTDVKAEIFGNVARVEVTQSFSNPYDKKIEAVYVFPLPHRAAVDDMEIHVGDRTIKGILKKRDEARRIYEQARKNGQVAALLDQERPNIFTQSVANILPGNRIDVKIRYLETLPYADQNYTFSFPMVVGPRFIPGAFTSDGRRGWSSNTTDVPDASQITPPVLQPGQRSSHDISLAVALDAGTQLVELGSPSHMVDISRRSEGRATIELRQEDSIPNKDFVLRYNLAGNAPRLSLLPHRKDTHGYFLMLIQPEANPAPEKITPKEMVFVVDGSGSMRGFPIEKVKQAMRHSLENLNTNDTFQIIKFSNHAETFAPTPVAATEANIQESLGYVESLSGRGGTIMLEGVRAALTPPKDPERLRIISFMTDGYIGNENQILTFLRQNLGAARLYSFGVGSSVNRYLLDKMAELGRGTVEYVLLEDDAGKAVKRFYERIRNPYLTDIVLDWGGALVEDVYPKRIPDLFVGQPVVLHGRYMESGSSRLTLNARLGGKPFQQKVNVHFPHEREEGEAIATLWARARIEELTNQNIATPKPEIEEEITKVALAHRLVSAYTSFVAVEEQFVTGSEQPVLVEVPVEMPAGVSYEGVFGSDKSAAKLAAFATGIVPGRGQYSPVPSVAEESLDAAGPYGSGKRSRLRHATPQAEPLKPAGVVCRVESARPSYRMGEPIEIIVTFENTSGERAQIPSDLSVVDGSGRFQVLDSNWKVIPHPTRQVTKPTPMELQPGARVTLRIVINGAGGYGMTKPGTYHIVLLGTELGLGNSNSLTIRILR